MRGWGSRHVMRTSHLLVVLALLSASLVPVGCSGSGSAARAQKPTAVTIDYAESPAAAADRLAQAMVAAKTVDELRPAAYEALARTGVAVRTPEGEDLAKTGERALSLWLFDEMADNLTLDFLEHQGWTLASFTQAIAEHPEGPGEGLLKRPETLGMLLRYWAEEAEKSPQDPEAFAPLLLARIAQLRGGGSDYTTGTIRPDQVELTYLEIEILTAGAFKSPAATGAARQVPQPMLAARRSTAAWSAFAPAEAYAEDNPCAWIEQKWGKEAQDFGEEGAGKLFDKALDKVKDWLGGVGDGGLSGSMSKAASAMKWTNFLTNMISLYGGYSLKLTWDPAEPHYLGADAGHGDAFFEITANVSTRPVADDATLACLKWAGVEKPTNESIKDCNVQWVPLSGTPKHAIIQSQDFTRQHVSEDGKAVIKLKTTEETNKDAEKSGKIKDGMVVIQADLTTYQTNPAKLMAATMFGGVSGGNLEVAKGWINNWFPKRAVARVPIKYHYLPKWRGVSEQRDGTRWVFTSGQGTKSIWTVTLEGGPIQAGPFTFKKPSGKSLFDLKSGSASCTLLRHMSTSTAGVSVSMDTHMPLEITLGGTDEAPTLEIDNGSGTNTVSVRGQSKNSRVEAGGHSTVTLTELPEE